MCDAPKKHRKLILFPWLFRRQKRAGGAFRGAEEKESRSHMAILNTLRQVIKAKRSLGGKKIT
eukprot:COSAG06_NODE_12074_length_1426_cov_6.443105_1_plen_62_part_10